MSSYGNVVRGGLKLKGGAKSGGGKRARKEFEREEGERAKFEKEEGERAKLKGDEGKKLREEAESDEGYSSTVPDAQNVDEIKEEEEDEKSSNNSVVVDNNDNEEDKPVRKKAREAEDRDASAVELLDVALADEKLTIAERAFRLAQRKRESQRTDKRLELTHRQRMERFTRHLKTLPEHFDIPKVGPG